MPATIADNVGDNVGDCAGMAADLFESYEIVIISSHDPRSHSAFRTLPSGGDILNPTPAVLFPLIVPAIGIFASVVGVYLVREGSEQGQAMPWAPINRGVLVIGSRADRYRLLLCRPGTTCTTWKVFWAVLTGVILMPW